MKYTMMELKITAISSFLLHRVCGYRCTRRWVVPVVISAFLEEVTLTDERHSEGQLLCLNTELFDLLDLIYISCIVVNNYVLSD